MSGSIPPCRTVRVFMFRGDNSRTAVRSLRAAFDAERSGLGSGPPELDRILVVGHAGVSLDLGQTIYGFRPDEAGLPGWEVFAKLKRGEALLGVVRDHTAVFAAARARGLVVASFDVILPDPQQRAFAMTLDGERQVSQYSYGFPDGDGDCNSSSTAPR